METIVDYLLFDKSKISKDLKWKCKEKEEIEILS